MATKTISGSHSVAYTFTPNSYTVTNLGTINVAGPTAVSFTGSAGTFINAGSVTGASYALVFAAGGANRVIFDPGATFGGKVSGGNSIGAAAISTLELASAAGTGTLSGLGTQFIDFASVKVDLNAKWALSGTNTVTGANSTLTNSGTLTGTGITLAAGATFYQNTPKASITNTAGNAVYGGGSVTSTVSNYGTITGSSTAASGVYLKAGGVVNNQSSGNGTSGNIIGLTGIGADGVLTVTNAGTISGSTGINLIAGGTVTNRQGGTITANGNGIAASQSIAVYNSGVIDGATSLFVSGVFSSKGGSVTNSSGGTINAAYGVVLRGAVGTVVNYGIIKASNSTAFPKAAGVGLGNGGTVTNQAIGTISGYLAVSIAGGPGTVVNAGLISSGSTSSKNFAVTFASGFANLLVFDPGASFSGTVDGGNSPGASVVSTLELASGTSTGTLSGLGSQFANFSEIQVNTAATWSFGGSNTIAQSVTLANAGTLIGAPGTASGAIEGTGGGGASPVSVATGGSVNNTGVMTGGAGGLAGAGTSAAGNGTKGGTGGQGAAAISETNGTITNGGSLTGGAGGGGGAGGPGSNVAGPGGTGGAGGSGVSLVSNGVITNTATITGGAGGQGGAGGASPAVGGAGGTGGAGGAGVYGASGIILSNAGLIIGGAGGAAGTPYTGGEVHGGAGSAGAAGVGISFTGNATVTNQSGGTIAGASGADSIDFGTGTSQLVVDPGAVFTGNVNGGNTSGGSVSSLEFASAATAGTISGGLGVKYINFPQVKIDAGAQWTNTVNGTLNQITLTVSGTLTNTYSLFDNNAATGFGVTVATGGELINKSHITASSDNAVSGRTGAMTIVNYGEMYGNSAAASGVYMGGGGTLTNKSFSHIEALYGVKAGSLTTIVNNAVIASDAATKGAGIYLSGGGVVTNQLSGTIEAKAITGNGIAGTKRAITVVNYGQITGSSGITLSAGGTVTNERTNGIIQGTYGIKATGAAATVINYGIIKAQSAAGYAVSLATGFADLVVLHQGDQFVGTVSGGNTIGAATVSTLELAVNTKSQIGVLSGLGTQYIDFAHVTVDSGAIWHLDGTNTAVYGITITDNGTLTNNGGVLTLGTGAAGGNNGTAGAAGTVGQRGGLPVAVTSTGTLTNTGTITGGAGGAGGAGVAGASTDGDLGGAGAAGGVGTSAAQVASGGSIINSATIIGGAGGAGGAGGDAGNAAANDGGVGGAGAAGGSAITMTGGSVTNSRTIVGGAGGVGGSAGAEFNSTGTGAAGGAGGSGIAGTTGTVINTGVIAGAAGGAGGSGATTGAQGANGVGVSFTSGGTVTNSGTIAGAGAADAIDFGIGTSRLIYVPGATFGGTVNGGNTIGASFVSTLELTTGDATGTVSAVGTLSSLGTNFTNFASVVVDPGAIWTVAGGNSLAAGATLTDQGTLLDSGQSVAGGGAVTIASTSGVTASDTVTANGVWAGMSQLVVGGAGSGSFLISSAGTAGATGLDEAAGAGGMGAITVTGSKSALTSSGSFTVGDAGLGGLTIDGGGTASAASMLIASTAGADGSSVDVSGAGSNLTVTGLLEEAGAGTASMQISGGATVTAGSFDGGLSAAAVADISVSGTGSELIVTGSMTVGDDGVGVLSISNGASVQVQTLTIGNQTDSSGALIVTNANLTVTGELNLGTAQGTGDLTVGPGAFIEASVQNLQGDVVLEGGELDPTVYIENGGSTTGGFGTIASDYILLEGTILSNGSKTGKETEVVEGTIVGGGTANIKGSVSVNGPGILQIGTHDTIELTGAVLNAATTTFTDNLTPTGTYTVNNSVIDVVFQDSTGVLQIDDIAGFAGTVATWKGGDQFVITGGTLSNLGVTNGDTLTFSDSGTGAGSGGIDSIIFGSGITPTGFNIVNGNTVQVMPCFAAGTRISTVRGEVAVEALTAGDIAITADGRDQPIVWIGTRTVNCRAHPNPVLVWPVRVAAGAFGPNSPARDLYLSPDHAVYVNAVLIPVKHLIDGHGIAQMPVDEVTYFHVELPCHDVLLAEGLPSESYLDTGDRSSFVNGGDIVRLHPDFSAHVWEALGCAPLVVTGPELRAVRQSIEAWRAIQAPSGAAGPRDEANAA